MSILKIEKSLKIQTDNGYLFISATKNSLTVIRLDSYKDLEETTYSIEEIKALSKAFKIILNEETKGKTIYE